MGPAARVVAMTLGLAALWACREAPVAGGVDQPSALVGAWRSHVRASSGVLAAIRDLGFMTVFNVGGTMTESSNYDGAPPVPPAYGVWRRTADRTFEARYAFWITKPPSAFDELSKAG